MHENEHAESSREGSSELVGQSVSVIWNMKGNQIKENKKQTAVSFAAIWSGQVIMSKITWYSFWIQMTNDGDLHESICNLMSYEIILENLQDIFILFFFADPLFLKGSPQQMYLHVWIGTEFTPDAPPEATLPFF